MDLSSLNQSLNVLLNKIKTYLDNPPKVEEATYEQQMDIKYVYDSYNNIVQLYSNLLSLLTEISYFISQCRRINRLISDNTSLEKAQKNKINAAITIITENAEPLYVEKERLKTLEMFYRNVYTRKDY